MDLFVERAVVSLLINDKAFGPGCSQRLVVRSLHWPDFEGDSRRFIPQCRDAIAQIIIGNKLRMFAGYEQNIPKTLAEQSARLLPDFINRKRDAEYRIIAREAAIFAVVDALVGKIKRRKKTNRFSEALQRELARPVTEQFKLLAAAGLMSAAKWRKSAAVADRLAVTFAGAASCAWASKASIGS